jgi:hypothetical protein
MGSKPAAREPARSDGCGRWPKTKSVPQVFEVSVTVYFETRMESSHIPDGGRVLF